MRIISGEWRSRPLTSPKGHHTRPTSDRAREALFSSLVSMLGEDLGEASVLDAFAGSGALGLEALSRGASSAVLLESDRAALAALNENVSSLGAGQRARVVAGDAFSLARRGGIPGGPFGLLFLDPPYRIGSAQVAALLSDLVAAEALKEGAVIVYEHAHGAGVEWPQGFSEIRSRRYGIAEVSTGEYRGDAR